MLSYQHGYHAGNYADVVKHATLARLLSYLTQKEKPLFYLETHAGRGIYDLTDKQALKTGVAKEGIGLLWDIRKSLPESFTPYIKILKELNPNGNLHTYPGSPQLALRILRSMDRLFCCELHPREFNALEQMPRQGKRVFYSNSDGFAQLQALLPPPERRGLIFTDPAYEIKSDYRLVPELLKKAYQQFETGSYCVWYPIVDKQYNEQLQRGFDKIGAAKHLRIEFELTPSWGDGMKGCGLWVINPPYLLADELKSILQTCCQLFNPGRSTYRLEN